MHAYNAAHPLNTREGARQTKACEICGTEFSYYPTVRRNAKYCSQECKGIGHSATMTGRRPSLGVYTSCATFRAMARVEFLDRCAVCGWDEAPNDVCHIIARRDGGSDTLENVVMLCPNHHRLFDRGQIAIDRIRAARANCVP